MWIKVKKPFGHLLVGEVIEVKDDAQHETLIKKGLVEETEAPKKEEKKPVEAAAYSTSSVLTGEEKKEKAPKKEEKK